MHTLLEGSKTMTIHVKVKSVYGNDLMYVVEPGKANLVRLLTGKKTVSKKDIYALRGLGIEVTQV
jgi:hypothetical protein